MTMNPSPSRKLPKVFVLIIPPVILMLLVYFRVSDCSSTYARGVRIFVLIIVIPIHSGEWKIVECLPRKSKNSIV
jgi:hypothetical protein